MVWLTIQKAGNVAHLREGVVKGGRAGDRSERNLDIPVVKPSHQSQCEGQLACRRLVSLWRCLRT